MTRRTPTALALCAAAIAAAALPAAAAAAAPKLTLGVAARGPKNKPLATTKGPTIRVVATVRNASPAAGARSLPLRVDLVRNGVPVSGVLARLAGGPQTGGVASIAVPASSTARVPGQISRLWAAAPGPGYRVRLCVKPSPKAPLRPALPRLPACAQSAPFAITSALTVSPTAAAVKASVGESRDIPIKVTVGGGWTGPVTARLEGPGAASFQVLLDSCATGFYTGDCPIRVRFAPTAPGRSQAVLRLSLGRKPPPPLTSPLAPFLPQLSATVSLSGDAR